MKLKKLRQSFVSVSIAFALIVAALCLLPTTPLVVPAHAEYSGKVSITGNNPAPRLSAALSAAGYTNPTSLDELTICDPTANANSFYLGNSASVNATTGFEIPAGICVTYRAAGGKAIEASSIFIYCAATQSAAITLRER